MQFLEDTRSPNRVIHDIIVKKVTIITEALASGDYSWTDVDGKTIGVPSHAGPDIVSRIVAEALRVAWTASRSWINRDAEKISPGTKNRVLAVVGHRLRVAFRILDERDQTIRSV